MIRNLAQNLVWSLAEGLVRRMPGEAAHRLAIQGLGHGLAPKIIAKIAPRPPLICHQGLETTFAGLTLPHPLGCAAGFDKNAEAMAGTLACGFGFVEVGTITPRPQAGNPAPRVFRLTQDRAVINRYGFNNDGMVAVAMRLCAYRQKHSGIVGVNIGANKDSPDPMADYHMAVRELAEYADYITVNVSSPNTPGLRGLQRRDALREVLTAAQAGMIDAGAAKPLVLKLSPDLDEAGLADALDVALEHGLAAVIIANTTTARPPGLKSRHRSQAGGLSGAPLFHPSSVMLGRAAALLKEAGAGAAHGAAHGGEGGKSLPLIAAGGVDDAATAYTKILLGAHLVQIYTGFAMKGVRLPSRMTAGLAEMHRLDGLGHISEARGRFDNADEARRHAEALAGKLADNH